MPNKKNADVNDQILSELTMLRRLTIFALTRWGATQGEIGKALGIDQASISRMFNRPTEKKRKRNGD